MRKPSAEDLELGTRSGSGSTPDETTLNAGSSVDNANDNDNDEKHATMTADEENDLAIARTDEIELPNGGYGWVVVLCVLGVNACTWGA